MCKCINFNNLRKKKGLADGGGGWVELTFVETQKAVRKTQKEGIENTENILFFEQ